MIQLVLFDIDGTLISTGGAGVKAFGKVSDTVFKQPDGFAGLSFAGRTDTGLVREYFNRHGIAPEPSNFRKFFDTYVFWLDHLLGHCQGKVLPGVLELIAALRKLPNPPLLGLLTGNIRLGAEIKLRHFGLWGEFQMGAFADDHEDRNQLARIAVERGRAVLGRKVPSEDVLIIGDTPLDIACARAIGARVLAVATGGYLVHQLLEHRPCWAVESLSHCRPEEVCA